MISQGLLNSVFLVSFSPEKNCSSFVCLHAQLYASKRQDKCQSLLILLLRPTDFGFHSLRCSFLPQMTDKCDTVPDLMCQPWLFSWSNWKKNHFAVPKTNLHKYAEVKSFSFGQHQMLGQLTRPAVPELKMCGLSNCLVLETMHIDLPHCLPLEAISHCKKLRLIKHEAVFIRAFMRWKDYAIKLIECLFYWITRSVTIRGWCGKNYSGGSS